MSTGRRRCAWLMLVLAGLAAGRPSAQSPLAVDAVIPASPSAALELSPRGFTSLAALRSALDAANVPYGLEGSTFPVGPLTIDLAKIELKSLRLNGMPLGAALDAIATVDTEFHWADVGGRVVIRSMNDAGLLDRPVAHFAVKDATLATALTTFVGAIDPQRSGLSGYAPIEEPRPRLPGTHPPAVSLSPLPASISVSLDDATPIAILDAIVSAAHARSWDVTFDTHPIGAGTMSVTIGNDDRFIRALSPVAMRHAPPATTPGTFYLSVQTDIAPMLENYAQDSGARVSIETPGVPAAGVAGMSREVPGLELLRVRRDQPAASIASIVALDSRYEMTTVHGVFRVAPKAGTPGRLLNLDRTVDGFVARHEPLGSVLDHALLLIGTAPHLSGTGSSGHGIGSLAEAHQAGDAAIAAPIDVSVPAGATVRDVLDAICAAQGSLSWRFRISSPNGDIGEVQLTSPDGWNVRHTVVLAGPAPHPPLPQRPTAATSAPDAAAVVRLPPALEKQIPRVSVYLTPTYPGSPFETLATEAHVVSGIEHILGSGLGVTTPPVDPRIVVARRPVPPLALGPGLLSDALTQLARRVPGSEVWVDDGVIDVAPASVRGSGRDFLDVPLDHFEASDISIRRAVGVLRHQLDPGFTIPPEGSGSGFHSSSPQDALRREQASEVLFSQHVTLSMDHATPRQILNRLVAQSGSLLWTATYRGALPTDVVVPGERTCTISLETFSDIAIQTSFFPVRSDPPAAAPAFPTPSIRPPAPRGVGAGAAVVTLPTNPQMLDNALNAFALRTHIPLGWEVIKPAMTRDEVDALSSAMQSGVRYDLSGLTTAEALTRILQDVPDYAWSLEHGIHHVRPKSFEQNPDVLLNGKIASLTQHFDSVADVLTDLADRLGFARTNVPMAMNDRLRAFLQTPILIDVQNGTARDVLDQLARQHGGLSWSAEYPDPSGSGALQLRVHSFDGINWGMVVRPR